MEEYNEVNQASKMKLHPTIIPYSGTVGGGLNLIDQDGRARFIVAIIGTSKGITKEQTAAISKVLIDGIHEPFDVPDVIPKPSSTS